MKQTKTKAFVLALLGIVGLSACGNPTADENVEVEWWVPCGSDTTGNNIYAYCSEMAAAFTEANPDIKDKVTSKGSYSNDYNGAAGAVSDALTGGNTPTMVTTYGTYVAAWRKAAPEAVADVTSHGVALEADADFNQDYLKVEKQQYNNTAYYSLPYSKSANPSSTTSRPSPPSATRFLAPRSKTAIPPRKPARKRKPTASRPPSPR